MANLKKPDQRSVQPENITCDWHIHSRNSCDCKHLPHSTTMAETFAAARAAGITDYGLTDHLHTPFNLPDIEASRREFDSLPSDNHLHFGIEASCVSEWELQEIARGGHETPVYGLRSGGPANGGMAIGIGLAEIDRFGIEYVIGGVHWPLYVPYERDAVIRDYHRQNMFLACHPLVTIIAHPWWWMGHWQDADGIYRADPWLDDFKRVPHSMHGEFAAAAREHGKVVEINLGAMLLNRQYPERFRRQYTEYLAGLKESGIKLSAGSDNHAQEERYGAIGFEHAISMLDNVGIHDDDLWRLPPRNDMA